MGVPFDVGVRDDLGNLRLAVEVKRAFGMTPQRARELHGWIVSRHPPLAHIPFLLVTPERGYLWHQQAEPTEIELLSELAPHFERIGIRPEEIHGYAFEALVASWLDRGLTSGMLPAPIRAVLPHDAAPWVTFEGAA